MHTQTPGWNECQKIGINPWQLPKVMKERVPGDRNREFSVDAHVHIARQVAQDSITMNMVASVKSAKGGASLQHPLQWLGTK